MIDLGIIGAGIMGERMARAALGEAADTVRVTGIWDPQPAALARITADLPALVPVASAETLIAAAACVYIASPPASHLAHAAAALAAGRAVFSEKPLAVDVPAAEAFAAAHEGARIAVNFPMASSQAVATLARWIGEGAVGRPRRLAIEVGFAHWPRPWQQDAVGWLDRREQGGFTREVVSHFLFLTRRLCGALTLLEGRAEFPEAGRSERAITARLTAGGVPATLAGGVGTTAKDDHNLWTLEGEAGAIRLRDWSIAERLGADGSWQPDPAALPNAQTRMVVLKRQLGAVARMTRGETHHLATLAEALDVQRVVERILTG